MKSELSGRPANELKGYESKISISQIHLYGLTHKTQDINTINMLHRALSVKPRGVEPRSEDFKSSAYTKSAKVPNVVAPDGFEPPLPDSESDVLTITLWSIDGDS